MAWTIEIDRDAVKDMKKLGKTAQRRIVRFLRKRIALSDDPRETGKPLRGRLSGLWRYRVGDYRVLCRILDQEFIVLVIAVGHRKNIYE